MSRPTSSRRSVASESGPDAGEERQLVRDPAGEDERQDPEDDHDDGEGDADDGDPRPAGAALGPGDERREGVGEDRGDDERPDDVPGEPQDDRGADDEGDERPSIGERPRVHRAYSTSEARRTPARKPR